MVCEGWWLVCTKIFLINRGVLMFHILDTYDLPMMKLCWDLHKPDCFNTMSWQTSSLWHVIRLTTWPGCRYLWNAPETNIVYGSIGTWQHRQVWFLNPLSPPWLGGYPFLLWPSGSTINPQLPTFLHLGHIYGKLCCHMVHSLFVLFQRSTVTPQTGIIISIIFKPRWSIGYI